LFSADSGHNGLLVSASQSLAHVGLLNEILEKAKGAITNSDSSFLQDIVTLQSEALVKNSLTRDIYLSFFASLSSKSLGFVANALDRLTKRMLLEKISLSLSLFYNDLSEVLDTVSILIYSNPTSFSFAPGLLRQNEELVEKLASIKDGQVVTPEVLDRTILNSLLTLIDTNLKENRDNINSFISKNNESSPPFIYANLKTCQRLYCACLKIICELCEKIEASNPNLCDFSSAIVSLREEFLKNSKEFLRTDLKLTAPLAMEKDLCDLGKRVETILGLTHQRNFSSIAKDKFILLLEFGAFLIKKLVSFDLSL